MKLANITVTEICHITESMRELNPQCFHESDQLFTQFGNGNIAFDATYILDVLSLMRSLSLHLKVIQLSTFYQKLPRIGRMKH